jgi:4-amino-4-deoxy-L-arabinose transferase-like glycosyltransferase
LHPEYPPHNPRLQAWVYLQLGGVTHFANRLPVQAFAVCLTLVLAAALRRVVRPGVAAALLVLVHAHAVTQAQTQTATADLMLACGIVTALDAWLRGLQGQTSRYERLALLLLGALVWTKQEGVLAAVVLGGLFLCTARPARRELWWWAIAPALFVAITASNAWHGFVSDLWSTELWGEPPLLRGLREVPQRVGILLEHFATHVLWAPGAQRGILLAFLLALLLRPRSWRDPATRVTGGTVVLMLLGYQLVLLLTPHELRWHLDTASTRLAWQVVPAATLGLALVLADLWPARVAGEAAPDPAAEPRVRPFDLADVRRRPPGGVAGESG